MSSVPNWLDTEEQYAWRMLLRINGRLLARLDADLAHGHGIGLADYEVLAQLSEAPERSLRMAELAERLLLSPSGLTRRIDSLARRGLVARQPCPSDARGSFAVLTDEGMTTLEGSAPTHVTGVRRYLFDTLDRDALGRLAEGLARVDATLAEGSADTPTRLAAAR